MTEGVPITAITRATNQVVGAVQPQPLCRAHNTLPVTAANCSSKRANFLTLALAVFPAGPCCERRIKFGLNR